MKKDRKRGTLRRAAAWVLAAFALIILSAALILQAGKMRYKEELDNYYDISTPLVRIPDIDGGFIPQGICFDPSGMLIITGYMGNFSPSPIYVVDPSDGSFRKILMADPDGKPMRGHAGGASILGETVFIAGSTGGCMYCFSLKDLLAAEDGDTVKAFARTELKNGEDSIRVSFTGEDASLVYAGEFHRDPLFRTHPSHATRTPYGTQKAYLFGYDPSDALNAVPEKVYVIPDNVQGACFADGYVFLSQSDGISSSLILAYSLDGLERAGTKKVMGKDIPMYILSPEGADRVTRVPPMAEEIYAEDGMMYILYESASNRYRIGKRMGLDYVMGTPLTFFLPSTTPSYSLSLRGGSL